jgi:hypothetical protein
MTGEVVTVRALWPMPGIERGAVVSVTLGPALERLIAAGRYELVQPIELDPAADAATPARVARRTRSR